MAVVRYGYPDRSGYSILSVYRYWESALERDCCDPDEQLSGYRMTGSNSPGTNLLRGRQPIEVCCRKPPSDTLRTVATTVARHTEPLWIQCGNPRRNIRGQFMIAVQCFQLTSGFHVGQNTRHSKMQGPSLICDLPTVSPEHPFPNNRFSLNAANPVAIACEHEGECKAFIAAV